MEDERVSELGQNVLCISYQYVDYDLEHWQEGADDTQLSLGDGNILSISTRVGASSSLKLHNRSWLDLFFKLYISCTYKMIISCDTCSELGCWEISMTYEACRQPGYLSH